MTPNPEIIRRIAGLVDQAIEVVSNPANLNDQVLRELLTFVQDSRIYLSKIKEVPAPVPASAELLWILSNGNANAFVSYLQTFPDASTTSLLKNPEQLNQILDSLEKAFPPGEPIMLDGVESSPLNSSNIWGFRYDPKNSRLIVKFNGKSDRNNGPVYAYEGVPKVIAELFMGGAAPAKTQGKNRWGSWWKGKQPSLGASLWAFIRNGGYPYQRLS